MVKIELVSDIKSQGQYDKKTNVIKINSQCRNIVETLSHELWHCENGDYRKKGETVKNSPRLKNLEIKANIAGIIIGEILNTPHEIGYQHLKNMGCNQKYITIQKIKYRKDCQNIIKKYDIPTIINELYSNKEVIV